MIPYESGIVLSIASPGGGEAEECDAFLGRMWCRAGAKLKYVINDVEKFGEDTPTYGGYLQDTPIFKQLIAPTISEVRNSIRETIERLVERKMTPGQKNVFNLIYAGHGRSSDGAMEFSDGALSGEDFYQELVEHYGDHPNKLHVNIVLDSCYSARFLIDFIFNSQSNETIYGFDCKVSALPDEKSYEMDFIEHGAFSFSLTHPGNCYVDATELARAVDNRDLRTIVKSLQGITAPNPVAFLTNGRQHSIELISGHHLSIPGAGSIELVDYLGTLTHAGLTDAIARAKFNYGGDTEYII
jgi:hypothetical protein